LLAGSLECEKGNPLNGIVSKGKSLVIYESNKIEIQAQREQIQSEINQLDFSINQIQEVLSTLNLTPNINTNFENLSLAQELLKKQELLLSLEEDIAREKESFDVVFNEFERVVLNLDTIQIEEYKIFYQEVKDLNDLEKIKRKQDLESNLSELKELVVSTRNIEFYNQIISYNFLDNNSIKEILSQASFENTTKTSVSLFDDQNLNQQVLDIARNQGYSQIPVANIEGLNYDFTYPMQVLASQAFSDLKEDVEAQGLGVLIVRAYKDESSINQEFLNTANLNEASSDSDFIAAFEGSLPAGLNPAHTGYSILIQEFQSEIVLAL
jgi:hypothetical protein